MILPVAKRPRPGTDIPLCSVPLSLTWLLTGVSWPTPAWTLVGANLRPERSGSRVERNGIRRTPKAPLTHGVEVGDWSGEGDAAGPPKRGGELIHGPEPRTHRKQPNGPDEFVARGWSKLVTP